MRVRHHRIVKTLKAALIGFDMAYRCFGRVRRNLWRTKVSDLFDIVLITLLDSPKPSWVVCVPRRNVAGALEWHSGRSGISTGSRDEIYDTSRTPIKSLT